MTKNRKKALGGLTRRNARAVGRIMEGKRRLPRQPKTMQKIEDRNWSKQLKGREGLKMKTRCWRDRTLGVVKHAAHRDGGSLRSFGRTHLGGLVTKMARGPNAKDEWGKDTTVTSFGALIAKNRHQIRQVELKDNLGRPKDTLLFSCVSDVEKNMKQCLEIHEQSMFGQPDA